VSLFKTHQPVAIYEPSGGIFVRRVHDTKVLSNFFSVGYLDSRAVNAQQPKPALCLKAKVLIMIRNISRVRKGNDLRRVKSLDDLL